MKKYFIILFALLSFISVIGQPDVNSSVKATHNYVSLKKFNGDTLAYVQHNFIDNKEKYIGKELNILLSDCEISIKSFLPGVSHLNKDISPNVNLEFYSRGQASSRFNTPLEPVDIIIEWSQPLPFDSVFELWGKNKGEWTDTERKYFGKQKIGDILTTRW